MTLLDNLFSKKKPGTAGSEREVPALQADAFSSSLPASGTHAADRKSLRLERRELLYAVVRESMSRIGILSSSYKFKVLSLDPRGRQYMIMMDLQPDLAVDPRRLGEIESVVTQNAQARHDIVVTAVYWRINEPISGAASRKGKPPAAAEGQQTPRASEVTEPQAPKSVEPAPAKSGRFEPIREDEVTAFKQALDAGMTSDAPETKARLIKSWRHVPVPRADFADTQIQESEGKSTRRPRPRDFQDTEVADSAEKISPLSSTQYGDLS
jgi:hypothetical protein